MLKCPRCDAPVPETGETCPNCGADIGWWMSREGQVYGPYALQTVQYCWRDGRIVDDDYVKLGRDEPWLVASEVFGTKPAPAQPVERPTPSPAPVAPPPQAPAPRKSNTLVIVLVLAGAAFVLLAALGIVAAILIPVFSRAQYKAQQTACMSNLKQISIAFHMYAADNDDQLPPADSWREALEPYLKAEQVYTCPSTGEQYVFNEALGGQNIEEINNPAEVPMAWDAPPEYDPETGPHVGQFNVSYGDGHVSTTDTIPQPP